MEKFKNGMGKYYAAGIECWWHILSLLTGFLAPLNVLLTSSLKDMFQDFVKKCFLAFLP